MKKISLVSLASLFFLLLCSAVALLLEGVLSELAAALIGGALILLASGILAFFARHSTALNLLCFFISAVAMGFLLRGWYIARGLSNSFTVMGAVSLAAVLYLWIFFALSRIPFIRRTRYGFPVLFVLYALLSVGAYLYVVFHTKTTYVSTFGYYMALELAFILAMSRTAEDGAALIRNLTLCTYSVLVAAIIAAVLALLAAMGGDLDCDCDGDGDCDLCDCFDGCNCGGDSGGKRQKKKK